LFYFFPDIHIHRLFALQLGHACSRLRHPQFRLHSKFFPISSHRIIVSTLFQYSDYSEIEMAPFRIARLAIVFMHHMGGYQIEEKTCCHHLHLVLVCNYQPLNIGMCGVST